jgi:hypothetical protein
MRNLSTDLELGWFAIVHGSATLEKSLIMSQVERYIYRCVYMNICERKEVCIKKF